MMVSNYVKERVKKVGLGMQKQPKWGQTLIKKKKTI